MQKTKLINASKRRIKMDKNKKIKILKDIIQIRSVNENEEEVAVYLKELLNKYNIPSVLIPYSPGRSSLVAELIGSGNGKVLGFTGHLDVVDAGDETRWQYPPYSGHVEEGRMYGRGTTDMKSGLAALTIAMIELNEKSIPFNGKIRLLATLGEEVGELGAMQLTEKGYADDLDGLIIGEPTKHKIAYTHMGSINYSVISHGKSAHSSMPHEGINAINHLNEFISEANSEMDNISLSYEDEVLGRTIHNITVISGGNQVNSIPETAELQANIRSIPAYSNDRIIDLLQSVIDRLNLKGHNLELKIDFNKISVKSDRNSKLIQAIQKVSERDLPLTGLSATTDAAEFTKSLKPFDLAIYGPGEPAMPHQVDEYVEIENYLEMIEMYQKIAIEYLK